MCKQELFLQGLIESGLMAIQEKTTRRVVCVMEIYKDFIIYYGRTHENPCSYEELQNKFVYIDGSPIQL